MSTGDLHRTAFDSVQVEAGATWTDWEGWAWAADFGDPVAEHQATRTACNMWDESPLRKWILRGPDAIALADALFANDMAALEIGQVRYGPICDEQGKMIMDGTVFKLADDHCLSITSYDSDLDWYRKVASDRGLDVSVEDHTAVMPHLQVQGPKMPRGARADHRGRRRQHPAVLPLHPRRGHGRRRPLLVVAHRILGRARV